MIAATEGNRLARDTAAEPSPPHSDPDITVEPVPRRGEPIESPEWGQPLEGDCNIALRSYFTGGVDIGLTVVSSHVSRDPAQSYVSYGVGTVRRQQQSLISGRILQSFSNRRVRPICVPILGHDCPLQPFDESDKEDALVTIRPTGRVSIGLPPFGGARRLDFDGRCTRRGQIYGVPEQDSAMIITISLIDLGTGSEHGGDF